MKLKVYTIDGTFKEEREFEDIPVFSDGKGLQSLKQAVLAYKSNIKPRTAKAKKRGEVSGSGKKPWRQKGTGNARHGSKRSPIWVGGGVVFGPEPRDCSLKLSHSEKQLALRRSFFERASIGEFVLIEKFFAEKPKTQVFDKIIKKITQDDAKVLLIDDNFEDDVILSVRNLQNVFCIETSSVNALELLKCKRIIASENALQTLIARMSRK